MPELQTILNNKDELITAAQEQLTAFLNEQGISLANDLSRIVGRGNFTQADIIEELTRLGYDEAVINAMENSQNIFNLSREASDAMGINFLLTATNEENLIAFLQQKQRFIQLGIKERIANDMYDYAIGAKLGQRPIAQIKAEASTLLETQFRRVGTEVETALTSFDRAVDQALFENVGIDKFVYFPGTLIETSRESCRRVVNDPRQSTGWTRAEIDAVSDVDFVLGGYPYYNCRHRWIPFSEKGLVEAPDRPKRGTLFNKSELEVSDAGFLIRGERKGIILSQDAGVNITKETEKILDETLNTDNINALKSVGIKEIAILPSNHGRAFGLKKWRAQRANKELLFVPEDLNKQMAGSGRTNFGEVLRHEIGHNKWDELSGEAKRLFRKKYQNDPLFRNLSSKYARIDGADAWAEFYAEKYARAEI